MRADCPAADRDDDLPRADGRRSSRCAVQHEVRVDAHEQRVLVARRLALDAVGDHHGIAPGGDRTQFAVRREARAAASPQPARLDGRDQRVALAAQRGHAAVALEVCVERRRRSRGREEAQARVGVRPGRRHGAHGATRRLGGTRCLDPPDGTFSNRSATAPPKIAMQAASTGSIQSGTRVGAHARAVQERDRPREVGRAVQSAPDARREAVAQQARDDERHDEIERERAEAEPQPVAVGRRRDDDRDRGNGGVGVDHGREHVHGEEGDGEQRDAAVEAERDEARHAARAPAARRWRRRAR